MNVTLKLSMKVASRILLALIIFSALFIFKLYSSPKTAFAATTDPAECVLDHVLVGSTSYAGTFSNPIPQFQQFTLTMACISSDTTNRGNITATLSVSVNGQTMTSFTWHDATNANGAKIDLGPYNGLPGNLGPLYAQYTITTSYASPSTGGGLQSVNCSSCTLYVWGNGATPTPTPPGGASCPAFRGFNPDPPVVNQSFQLQYNVPSNPDLSLTYQFHWTEKDGTKGTTSLNETTAAAYGVWVGTFTFNQETTITLGFLGYQGQWSPFCDSHTVFSGITASPPPGGSLGKNPCTGGTCQTAIGNIPTNLGDFATAVLRIALGIAGGIVLILMVIGSIRVMASSGDPQRVAAGRDMIVAALAGALFIAFSVMIMQFFGTAIVPIPGLTFGT